MHRPDVTSQLFFMKNLTLKLTPKEAFALIESVKRPNQVKKRKRFGVTGLSTRISEQLRKIITKQEFDAFREEWKRANPPDIQIPKKKIEPPKPKIEKEIVPLTTEYTSYDPTKDNTGVWRAE
jgi:hypothetical protein